MFFVPIPQNTLDIFSQPVRTLENSDELPFSVLAQTMRRVIGMMGEGILVRSPNLGCIELRKAIQIYLAQSRGIIADIEQIVIGSGSEYLYNLIIELLGRNLVYAIASPSYKKLSKYILCQKLKFKNCLFLKTELKAYHSKNVLPMFCIFLLTEAIRAA